MKRKPFIAISVLALFMFVGCSKKSEMLFKAVYENNVARARRLIEAGADVNANNNFGNTALLIAAMENAVDISRLLIESGADVNAKNEDGSTALMYALKNKATDVAALLEASGAK